MTRLGLSSYAAAWQIGIPGFEQPEHPLDAFGLLRLADELRLKRVQIADNMPLDALDAGALERLREDARARGIAVEVGTRGIAADYLRRYIDIAAYFASPILRVVVDTAAHHPAPEEVVTLIRAVLPDLQAHGVTLAVENHDRFKSRTLADIIEAIDSPQVGICLDTVNSFGALEGTDVVVASLGAYVVNLHIKPFTVRRMAHNLGFEVIGTPADEGMLDVAWLLDTLHGYNRPLDAILELWTPPETRLSDTIAKENAWIRQSVAYLRTLMED